MSFGITETKEDPQESSAAIQGNRIEDC